MRTIGRSLCGVLLAAVCVPGSAWALGFGDIRLKSALNSPLDAEIEITATSEELASLRAGLASREQFARNGMDFPAFLTSATVRVARTEDGRNVLQVHTTDPVTEPFLTMLVQVSYARGQLIREYTVLLDPPVFANQSGSAGVSAPSAGTQARAGDVDRGAAATVAAPSPQPLARPAAAAAGSYRVRPGDTLSGIVGSRYPRTNREAALLGIYRANPQAFDGNMNALRRDALLSLPSEDDLARVGPAEARTEVARQYRAWAEQRGSGRLRLVPPSEAATASAARDQAGNLQQRVAELEQQLAEKERLLTLRNAELARLQQRGGAAEPAAGAPPATPASAAAPPAAAPPPAASAPKPAASAAGAPKSPPTSETETSVLDWILANWYLPVAGVALLAAVALFLRGRRARQDAYGEQRFDSFGSGAGVLGESSQTLPARPLPQAADSILVEETGTHRPEGGADVLQAPTIAVSEDGTAAAAAAAVAEGGSGLDQGDPLAEADFHMAYGLYDQAADLVNHAIAREPGRRELKLKLLEVYFVWGNKQKFEELAAQLAESRDGAVPGEWEKIVIMGRQIAPDNALFTATSGMAAAAGSVDLNLEGGQNRIDFNLMGEPSMGGGESEVIDLDLAGALGDLPGVEAGGRPAGEAGVDFLLDTPVRGEGGELHTQLMAASEHLRSLRDNARTGEAPTSELPHLDEQEQGTIRMKLDAPAAKAVAGDTNPDNTAELALDDLGLDIGTIEPAKDAAGHPEEIVLEGAGDGLPDLESGPEGNWLLQGTEDSAEHVMLPDAGHLAQSAAAPAAGDRSHPSPDEHHEQRGEHDEPSDLLAAEIDAALSGISLADAEAVAAAGSPIGQLDDLPQPEAATRELVQPDELQDHDLLSGFAASNAITAVMPSPETPSSSPAATGRLVSLGMSDSDINVQIGGLRAAPVTPAVLPEMDPPTMSEVGTKLDLARAYMDMGDPEGARSILDEVLAEGSASQKQEARRLIDSLPG